MKLPGTGLWVGWCSEKCVAYCLSMCSAMQRESALLCLGTSTFLEEGNSDIHQEPHWDHTDSQQRGHPGKEWKKSCKEGQGQHTLINFLSEESLTHPKVCQCYSLGEGIWYVGWNYALIDSLSAEHQLANASGLLWSPVSKLWQKEQNSLLITTQVRKWGSRWRNLFSFFWHTGMLKSIVWVLIQGVQNSPEKMILVFGLWWVDSHYTPV